MVPTHVEELSYLSFNDLVSRIHQSGYQPDPGQLRVQTRFQWLCEASGLSAKQAVHYGHNGQLVINQLPAGCTVKRGIDVLPEDHVSVDDQILSFYCNVYNQICAVSIQDLVYEGDQFDPNS